MSVLGAAREVAWQKMLAFDRRTLLAVRRLESAALTDVMQKLTRLGDASTWIVVGLALGTVGGPRFFALLGLGSGFAVILSQLLKRLCCRERPHLTIQGLAALAEIPDAFSFPSGHTAAAFAAATALAGEGTGLAVLVTALAVGIALSRIYLGAHYPLDVLAGAALGLSTGLAARLLVASFPALRFVGLTALASWMG
jgi:undecaprenyl-diphosphatase